VLENGARRIAFEIDDEASHNPKLVSSGKFWDDLLKQNSMVHMGWDVYRWAVRQMQMQPETVKDELRVFLGNYPQFREIKDYLPTQRGHSISAENLHLKEHQKEALASLAAMREKHETIALLYRATGTGKTVTAVMDAKSCGEGARRAYRVRQGWVRDLRLRRRDFPRRRKLFLIPNRSNQFGMTF
jgi:hypothetical protein